MQKVRKESLLKQLFTVIHCLIRVKVGMNLHLLRTYSVIIIHKEYSYQLEKPAKCENESAAVLPFSKRFIQFRQSPGFQ